MDDGDRAKELADGFADDALKWRRTARAPVHGTKYCIDCEEEIPPSRRLAHPGALRCVPCQGRAEILNPYGRL